MRKKTVERKYWNVRWANNDGSFLNVNNSSLQYCQTVVRFIYVHPFDLIHHQLMNIYISKLGSFIGSQMELKTVTKVDEQVAKVLTT